ncbi:Hypothetical protein FKW44_013061 [Caligus rogercresseyi]|uniref:Uncharacterized protein n=1 Tax=Caligus rogercresseyi TaxID=217165 RepID=A0A7T8KA07_CALRO|nr:Hypothetical protein FKW44_013061 [Caligus rogercresseyi]
MSDVLSSLASERPIFTGKKRFNNRASTDHSWESIFGCYESILGLDFKLVEIPRSLPSSNPPSIFTGEWDGLDSG